MFIHFSVSNAASRSTTHLLFLLHRIQGHVAFAILRNLNRFMHNDIVLIKPMRVYGAS